jgi:putative FmdB family regulatory protein
MPTYEYECKACGYTFETFHAMSAEPLIECPDCHRHELIKLIGIGGAVIIKGTETPCHGGRSNKKKLDRLSEGKNKNEKPFWRDGPINKSVLKNPKKYIEYGEID